MIDVDVIVGNLIMDVVVRKYYRRLRGRLRLDRPLLTVEILLDCTVQGFGRLRCSCSGDVHQGHP